MKEIIRSKYSRLFIGGLALTIICAWFSTGFYHVDEHFQVLEFANWKMGNTTASNLPWEFNDKLRASLLPDVVYSIAKIMEWCGFYNPFMLTFLLRLITGIATWCIAYKFCLLLLPQFKTPKGERIFILMSMFMWFVPYLNVRFTSENISGILFLYGAYIILRMDERTQHTLVQYVVAGFLFGVSLFIRFQLIVIILAFTFWLIKYKKTGWKNLFVLFTGVIAAIGLNTLLDCWFYGEPSFTMLNAIKVYVTHSTTGVHGTEANPVWFYFLQFTITLILPFSLFLLAGFAVGIYKNLKDPLVWAIIPFVLIHCIIRHKELRFLFPVTFIFIYITALGIDYLLTQKNYLKWQRVIYPAFIVLTIPLLIYRTFAPADIFTNYYKFLYTVPHSSNTPVFHVHYRYHNMFTFYNNPDLKPISVDSLKQINSYLQINKPQYAYFFSRNPSVDSVFNRTISGYKTTMVYCFFPNWLLKYDIDKWEEKTQIWRIYRFDRIANTSALNP